MEEMIAAQVALVGTPSGCTPDQLQALRDVLLGLVREGTWELHLPDAMGVPQEAHAFWHACRQPVVTHPSRGDGERSRLECEGTRPCLPVRERDVAMVAECQAVVLVPGEGDDWSGWSVYDCARRRGRALIVVLPDGSVRQWTHGLAPLFPEMVTSS